MSRSGAAATSLPGGTAAPDVAALYAAVVERLAGRALPPLLPHAPGHVPDLPDPREVPDGTAVLLRTSGSTSGSGRLVALTADALTASARATERRLGGPGHWVLALPAHHVAGLQVLVRSALAGRAPTVVPTTSGFDVDAFVAAVGARAGAGGRRTYVSLVPTQLVRLLDAGADLEPLRRVTAFLVGGAATHPDVLARARAAGLAVVTTYGMTETGGGCVYDGRPLDGVEIRTEEATGRVLIAGPVLATGYVGAAEQPFLLDGGRRWLRTADRGRVDGDRLEVLGRVDDVISTGGVKVSPALVERILAGHPAVAEVAVVGVPDPEWGQLVTAVVVPAGEPPALEDLRNVARASLDGAHAPRALVTVASLPLRGPGKIDRAAAARVAADELARGGGEAVRRARVGRAG